MARPEDRELVPLKPGFDVVWHGFDRAQVKQYLDDLDAEIKLLAADRDAALSQVADLTEQLTASHARAAQLNKQVNGLAELPKNTDDLDDRGRRVVQLAQHQAAEVIGRAQAAASHTWASAEDAAAKLRGSYEKMLADLDKQRHEMRDHHAELVKQARVSVADMTTAATKQRHEQDAQAEGRRVKIEQDFERGMTAKQQTLAKEIDQQRGASRAEAERRVREATAEAERRVREATERAEGKLRETTDECHRRVNDANHKVQDLRSLRGRITQQLHAAHKLMKDATPMLDPLEEERTSAEPTAATAAEAVPAQRPEAQRSEAKTKATANTAVRKS